MKRLAFVLAAALVAGPAAAQESASGDGPSFSPVTWERLLNAADEPENWLMYSATLDASATAGSTRSTTATSASSS